MANATPPSQGDTAVSYTLRVDTTINSLVLVITGQEQDGAISDGSPVDLVKRARRVLANNWDSPGHAGSKSRKDEHGNTTDIQS